MSDDTQKPKRTPRDFEPIYKDVTANLNRMGEKLLKLLRHKDATEAQIIQARSMYCNAYNTWQEIRHDLRERYPGDRNLFDKRWPWNENP